MARGFLTVSLSDADMAQDFNAEPIINRAARCMDIVLKSRTPVHVCEQ
jgi:hypothetical protein